MFTFIFVCLVSFKHFCLSTCIFKLTFWTGNLRDAPHTHHRYRRYHWYRYRYGLPYHTEKLGTFGTVGILVPRISVRSVRNLYRYRWCRYDNTYRYRAYPYLTEHNLGYSCSDIFQILDVLTVSTNPEHLPWVTFFYQSSNQCQNQVYLIRLCQNQLHAKTKSKRPTRAVFSPWNCPAKRKVVNL